MTTATATKPATKTVQRIYTMAGPLLAVLDTCMATVAKNSGRPVLEAVRIVADGEKTAYIAADGFALVIVEMTGDSGTYDGLISADCVKSIIAAIKQVPKRDLDNTPVILTDEQFEIPGFATIPVAQQQGTYPDYEKLVPDSDREFSKFAVNAKLLKTILAVVDRHAHNAIFRIFPSATPSSPMTATWVINDNVSVRYVLMPMFVNWTS